MMRDGAGTQVLAAAAEEAEPDAGEPVPSELGPLIEPVALAKRSYEKADVVRRKMFELWVHDKDLQHAELIQVCRPSFDPSSLTLEHARPRPSSSHQTGGCSGQRACPHAQLGIPETSSRADSGIPPAASRPLHSLTHTPSWVYRRRLTGRLWNTTSCLTAAPLTHSQSRLQVRP